MERFRSAWKDAVDDRQPDDPSLPDVVRNILLPINRQKGDDLPVSTFKGYEDGTIDVDLSEYINKIDIVSVGGESGENARACNFEWVKNIKYHNET